MTISNPDSCTVGRTYYYNPCTTAWALIINTPHVASTWDASGYHYTITGTGTDFEMSERLAEWTNGADGILELQATFAMQNNANARLLFGFDEISSAHGFSVEASSGNLRITSLPQNGVTDIDYTHTGLSATIKMKFTRVGATTNYTTLLYVDAVNVGGSDTVGMVQPKGVWIETFGSGSAVVAASTITDIYAVGNGLPSSCGGAVPTYSTLLPSATGKIAHAKILRQERSPQQATAYHQQMADA